MLIPQFSVERVIRYSYSYLLFVNYTTICTSFIVTHPTTNQPLCVCVWVALIGLFWEHGSNLGIMVAILLGLMGSYGPEVFMKFLQLSKQREDQGIQPLREAG